MLHRVVARVRSLWQGVRRRADIEQEMTEEFRHHIDLRTDELIGRGLSPAEAARQARIEFGHVESHREHARSARGLKFFDQTRFSWLDVKLGVRMLVKYPGLSLVSVLGMSVAMAVGAGGFAAITAMMDTTLPLHDGERIVSIQNNTTNPGNPERQSLHDFILWRDELRSVEDLSAFTADNRNIVSADGRTELVRVAEMTASGFRVARVAPVLGRPLVDEDEQRNAPPVVVIAFEEWQRRFAGDPDIIGRPLRLGSVLHTIVGVMPEEFRFPLNDRFWIPLRLQPPEYEMGGGPSIDMFGRLAPGATFERAQLELTTIGQRMAAAYPESHASRRPVVLPYTHPFFDIDSPMMVLALRALQIALALLLLVVAVNVAVLVYARTATRSGEIAVRTALGASRRRVVTQLFVEGLVLSVIAAAVGLTIAGVSLDTAYDGLRRAAGDRVPFWFDFRLSPATVVYVAALTIVAGAIIGVVPALQATGRRLQAGLQLVASRGSQMQLGRTWSALIVVQVAIAVAALPFAIYMAGQGVLRGTAEARYPADEFLRAYVSLERIETPADPETYNRAFEARFVQRAGELLRRLEGEPGVAGVTFATHFPGDEGYSRVEVDGSAGQSLIRSSRVDPALFDVFGMPILAGRAFSAADTRAGATAVIVDEVFAQRLLGGRVLGRRVRIPGSTGAAQENPWREVVGVVPAITLQDDFDYAAPRLFLPATLAGVTTVPVFAVRVQGTPAAEFARRVRDIAIEVDPALQLHELRTAADAQREAQQALLFVAIGIVTVTVSVLLLSAAGIYAMMSFTVARRRREIGIRAALGANPRRILTSIFARAGSQLGAGVVIGLAVALAIGRAIGGGPFAGKGLLLLPVVAALMMTVGLLAALGPARRGLAVQPTEALREE